MEKKNTMSCDCNAINEEIVRLVKEKIPKIDTLNELTKFFKIIGDFTRLKILYALSENELCVCDICSLLNMTQTAISHQLRVLKKARIVKNRRDGKHIYYALDDEHIKEIFETGLIHINEEER